MNPNFFLVDFLWVQNFFLWVFRCSEFFLVGISWVQSFPSLAFLQPLGKQYENCTTQKKEQHENSAIPKKCKLEIAKHEKIATRKKRKVKIVQYEQSIVTDWNFEKNCIRRVHTNAVLNSAYQWRGLLTILPVLISKMKAIIMKISQATGIINVVIYRCNHN